MVAKEEQQKQFSTPKCSRSLPYCNHQE